MDTANLPKTRKEAQETGNKYYFTGQPCKHGHVAPRKTKGACVACLKVEWAGAKEKRAEYFKQYNQSDAGKEAKQSYYARNKNAVKARADARTPEEKKRWKQKHKVSNPDYYKTLTSLRKRRHRNATPKWLTAKQKTEIRQLYQIAITMSKTTGERYVVDHIIPLISDEVCGLHVPWNLRVITQEENLRKSNKLLDTPYPK
jgi:hypothetical protein